MSDLELGQLEELAGHATPGQWFALTIYPNHGEVVIPSDDEEADPQPVARTVTHADAKFIAAASPAVVLRLVSVVRNLGLGEPTGVVESAWGRVVDAVTSHPGWDEEEGDGPHDIADFVVSLLAEDAEGVR